jgi:hypothetical protein
MIAIVNPAWEQLNREFACDHAETEIRRLVASNGVRHFREQCLRCGDSLRSVRVRDVPLRLQVHPVAFDESLRKAWGEAKWERFRAIQEETQSVEREERRRAYRKYLATPMWTIKRQLVLDRAGDLCEGCRRRRPVEVHHLTYERLGREMLFDLVAVCRPCHEAIHDRDDDDDPEGE